MLSKKIITQALQKGTLESKQLKELAQFALDAINVLEFYAAPLTWQEPEPSEQKAYTSVHPSDLSDIDIADSLPHGGKRAREILGVLIKEVSPHI